VLSWVTVNCQLHLRVAQTNLRITYSEKNARQTEEDEVRLKCQLKTVQHFYTIT